MEVQQAPVPQRQRAEKRGYRWLVVGLIFTITIINYMDRSALAYAILPISQKFHLNNADFGLIASAFGFGYVLMTALGGIIVDHFGSRRIWCLSAFFWSAVTILLGLASGFWMIFFLRAALGIAEGPHFPALTRSITDWLPKQEQARATALGLIGVPLASVIGAPLISCLIIFLSWQTMFICLGLVGMAWVLLWYCLFSDYPENNRFVSADELKIIRGQTRQEAKSCHLRRKESLKQGRTTWKFILTNPSLLSNNLAFFTLGYLAFFALNWLPGFLEQTYNLNLKDVGIFLIAPWATAAILVAFAGYLSDWLWRKTGSSRLSRSHLIWISQLLSAAAFTPVIFFHSLPVAILSISLGLGFGFMPNAAFYALNADLTADRAGTSIGITDAFFALAGIISPAVTGFVAEQTGSFNAAFGLLICLTVLSALAVFLFQFPDKVQQAVS